MVRSMWTRKPKKAKQRKLSCTVAVEVSGDQVSMVIVGNIGPDGVREVRGRRETWLHEAPSLNSEQGVEELSRVLQRMVEEEKLAGGNVNVALGSDFCVTRVLAGETDKILTELRHLRERSAHYLSLGAGPKETSECIRSIDAKNSQAWLTVTNRQTLENISKVMDNAGLYPALIEHSMIGLCRAVGRMGGDIAGPVIIIEPNDRGVDLGISYRGQLLFDYRPGGIRSKEHVAEIVEKHLERIQRYSTRFFRFATGQIRRVYLVGQQQDAELVRQQFASSTRLTAELLNPALICPKWRFDSSVLDNPGYLAAFGSALIEPEASEKDGSKDRAYPDLMDVYRRSHRDPIWPAAKRHLWPVAAAACLGTLIHAGALTQTLRARGIEQKVTEAENTSAQARVLRMEIENATTRAKFLKVIDDELQFPEVHLLLGHVGAAKKELAGVFLDRVALRQLQDVTLEGKAENLQLVYVFENNLKTIPMLREVHIETLTDVVLPTSDKGVGFKINCKFDGSNDQGERKDSNG